MESKDKKLIQLRKDALISSLSRKGLSTFEAKQKAELIFANKLTNSNCN